MTDALLPVYRAALAIPPGRYGVAVSGGGDSVAALSTVVQNPALVPVVLHLDHQTRGDQSAADAAFAAALADRLKLQSMIWRRDAIESPPTRAISNPSARFRSARLDLYRRAISIHKLAGVILGHHADDQSETVLIRLLHGRGVGHVNGMAAVTSVGGVRLVRPFLHIPSADLRSFAAFHGQTWRDDASNRSDDYLRNRLRRWCRDRPGFGTLLSQLHDANQAVDSFIETTSPILDPRFRATDLAELPAPLARRAARQWLAAAGCDRRRLSSTVCDRLTLLATDAAAHPAANFPNHVTVKRSGGWIGPR